MRPNISQMEGNVERKTMYDDSNASVRVHKWIYQLEKHIQYVYVIIFKLDRKLYSSEKITKLSSSLHIE